MEVRGILLELYCGIHIMWVDLSSNEACRRSAKWARFTVTSARNREQKVKSRQCKSERKFLPLNKFLQLIVQNYAIVFKSETGMNF